MKTPFVSRSTARSLFPLAATLIALALLSGCGKPQPQLPVSGPTDPAAASRIVILTWDNYLDPDVLASFTETTGIEVVYKSFGDTDELVSDLKSNPSEYDVVVADDSIIDLLREFKLIRRLDHSQLKNTGNLDDRYLGLHFDPDNAYSLPYLWGTTGIGYRADKIPDPDETWNILWDESLKGKIIMLRERHEAYAAALKSAGHEINSEDPAALNAASDKLLLQAKTLEARYGDDAEVRQALIDGTAWVATCYSGDAFYAAEDNEHISYFIPREGAPLWIDSFVLSRDSQNLKGAYQFLDFMMTAEAAAGNANYLFYASPNKAAIPFLDEELLNDERIFVPDDVLARCDYHRKLNAAREIIINNGMRHVFKALPHESPDEEEVASSAQSNQSP